MDTHVTTELSALANDIDVQVAHLLLGLVTLAVTGKRQIGEHPMERGESTIEVGENLSKILGDSSSDLSALKSTRSRQDSDFRDSVQDVEGTPFVDIVHLEDTERRVLGHELNDFIFNHANVGTEVLETETEFDEFLLFHEEFVRAVVNHIFTKDGGRQVLVKENRFKRDNLKRFRKRHTV